jgi:hypothetical protein
MPLTHKLTSDQRAILLLALIVLGFFLPAFLSTGMLIEPRVAPWPDIPTNHWPDFTFYVTNWRAGRIPLWDPLVGLGRPLPGDPDSLFMYPFDFIFLVLPPALGFNVLEALHVFLAGLFTFWLLRHGYHTSIVPALFSGLAFAFGPKFMAHLAVGHLGLICGLAWTPAVLLGLKRSLEGNLLAAALAGFALALQLPTHIQMPYYTAAIGCALGLWQLLPLVRPSLRGDSVARGQIVWTLKVYLVWLAVFVLAGASTLLPLLELMPYTSRVNFSLADSNQYALPPLLLLTLATPAQSQFHEWTMFLGVLPPVLGGIAWLGGRRSTLWFFTLLAGFALLYALGIATPLFGLALTILPGFRLFRVPTRLWFFGGLAVAVLAGFGLEALTTPEVRDRLWRWRRPLALGAGIYLIAGGAAAIAYFVLFQNWHGVLILQFVTALCFILLTALWLRKKIQRRIFQWLLIGILLMDLFPFAAQSIKLIDPRREFLRSTPALDFVSVQPGLFRVYSTTSSYLSYAVAAERGIETLDGLLSFQMGPAVEIANQATGCENTRYTTSVPSCLGNWPTGAKPDAARLGLLNVRYVVSASPLAAPDFKLVLNGNPAVYENQRWQPRVKLAQEGQVEIVNRYGGYYKIKSSAKGAAQLIVSEFWMPGWQARVDGHASPVERVEDGLVGINLPAGEHDIELTYAPLGWRLGWPISLGAVIGLAVWAILSRFKFKSGFTQG